MDGTFDMVVNVMTFRAEFIRDNHNALKLLNWRETVTTQFQNPTQCPQPWMLMISLWRKPPPQHLKTKQKEKERQRIWKRSVSKSRRYSAIATSPYFTSYYVVIVWILPFSSGMQLLCGHGVGFYTRICFKYKGKNLLLITFLQILS